MVVLVLAVVIVVGVGVAYKRVKKHRAQKRARKLAALTQSHTASSAAQATECEDDSYPYSAIIIAEESNPPPYSTPTPRPAELPEGLICHPTVPEQGHSETYNIDKPPSYSSTVLQVQNA